MDVLEEVVHKLTTKLLEFLTIGAPVLSRISVVVMGINMSAGVIGNRKAVTV